MVHRWFSNIMAALVTSLALVGCANNGGELPPVNPLDPQLDERRLQRANAQQLYKAARSALDAGDNATALTLYSRLDASYPFTPESTQGQLESIYARFRNFEPEAASAAADRFLRAHPRHPHVDYVLYLRGLIFFDSTAVDLLDLFDVDSAGRDPVDARRSFQEFSRLLQTYPNSPYAADARRRMLWLRERIAEHYFGIAEYYRWRGACVAAIRRGHEILDEFRETRVVLDTLALLTECYKTLGLDEQAGEMARLLVTNKARWDTQDSPAEDLSASDSTAPAPPAL